MKLNLNLVDNHFILLGSPPKGIFFKPYIPLRVILPKSVPSNDRFFRLYKMVCHIYKTRVPSIAFAIFHLSEIVDRLL